MFHTLWSFFIVVSTIVFIHEFGHYFAAKLCGVKIEEFSIGFGKEIVGCNDRSGTRWKISWLPLGGYVKMYGDSSAASTSDTTAMENMTEEQRALTFHYKPLYKKAIIVVAGPLSNFVLTVLVFTWFIMTSGLPSVEPVIGQVMPGSPAQAVGLLPGDRILEINGTQVESFNDIPYLISTNLGTPVNIKFGRVATIMTAVLTPVQVTDDDGLGNKITHPQIGIKSAEIKYEDVGLVQAIHESMRRTSMLCTSTLKIIGQMATGKRGAHDLKGPIGIAQMSGQATDKDVHTVLWLIAMLSANLGLVNLFPIPMLDGGHLLYYGAEALSGRPVAQKVQDYGFRVGFALLTCLMAFTLFNDLRSLM